MRTETIGRYEVIETLARGGMGVVYKARDPLIDRIVAVKTLGIGLSPIEAQVFRKRFAREAKSAGRLNHPNIVTIHDMGESDDGAYIAMEFLEGRSLRDVLDSGVVLLPPQAARIAVQVADGLAYAHRNGVVHCDIKPGNVMLLENGAAKITDFGIAMLPTGSRTFAGNVLGSPRYISPEQIVGRPIDERSDIFSLGAVLYEMLTGVPPFAGDAIDEILYQVINERPEAPSRLNRSIPATFDAIVERALAKDPGDRYQHVQEMADALRPLASEPPMAHAPLPPIAVATPVKLPPGHDTVDMPPPPDIPSAVELVAAAEKRAARASSRRPRRLALIAAGCVLVALGIWGGFAALAPEPGDRIEATTAGIDSRPAAVSAASAAAAQEPTDSVAREVAAVSTQPAAIPIVDAHLLSQAAGDTPVAASTAGLPAGASSVDARTTSAPATPPVIAASAERGRGAKDPISETVPPSPRASTPGVPAPAAKVDAAPKPAAAAATARLGFAVSPWGEIYVDGRKRGVSPPLNELRLAPGTYRVEIRNTGFDSHVETVELRADARHRIKYKFQ